MKKKEAPIGFFDSGIGGKTTLEETIKLLPNEDYIYFADSKNNPYGDKSDKEIYSLVKTGVDFLIKKGCKMIVLACNTATNVAIKKLREEYNIPFIGTEPALKQATEQNKGKNILVMATTATIRSEKFLNIYKTHFTPNITLLPCPNLAYLIEQNKFSDVDNYLENILKNYKKIEVVVLGCTHYLYIKENIKNILGNVKFIDGNEGIAKQVKKILKEEKSLNDSEKKGNVIFYDTSNL